VEELGGRPWWFGHEYPERLPDRQTAWSWNCDACMMHLVAAVQHVGGEYAEEFTPDGAMTPTSVAATLVEARQWRAEQGLRAI